MAWTTLTNSGERGWMTEGGAFYPESKMGPMQQIPAQNWFDVQAIQNAGGIANPQTGIGMLPNPASNAWGGGNSVSQQDINKMIQDAMNPFLQQMRQYQTGLADMYRNNRQGGPFDFLSAPMTFNKPTYDSMGALSMSRPSYGAPVDRGFYPGGYPQFQQPSLVSGTPGLGGMFSDPFLLTLAETLFPGGPSWLPEDMKTGGTTQPSAPSQGPSGQTAPYPGGMPLPFGGFMQDFSTPSSGGMMDKLANAGGYSTIGPVSGSNPFIPSFTPGMGLLGPYFGGATSRGGINLDQLFGGGTYPFWRNMPGTGTLANRSYTGEWQAPTGPASAALENWRNPVTGESKTVSSGGWTPPSADWVRG